jgi:Uma2 family endonuclease
MTPIASLHATANTVLRDVTWETLERLDIDLDSTGARFVYLDGWLEIMSPPSEAHETPKCGLGQLLEVYMRTKKIRFYGRGSTTIGMKSLGARKEPDASYCLGRQKDIPDLAIEITVTSGGVDVLEIYRRIGVSEVWFWKKGVISIHCLRESEYECVMGSELLPDLDIQSIEFHLNMPDQYDAVNAFIETLGR